MPDPSSDKQLRLRSGDITWQETGDDIVVLDLRTSHYLTVTTTGVGLWKKLADGCSEAELTEFLHHRYDLAADVAAEDVSSFLRRLVEYDLLES